MIPEGKSHSSISSGSGSGAGSGIGALAITPTTATGALTAGLGVRASALATGGRGTALAPSTTTLGGRSTHAVGTAHAGRSLSRPNTVVPRLRAFGTVIDHFIRVIPAGVWIALAVAIAVAVAAAAAAFRSTRRARRTAGEVAAVTAVALTDSLTGVLNRRGFIEAADRELDRARRYEHPVALAFVDIRGLKAVNDTEGHLAGDSVLEQVSMLLRESARTHDLVGRIGGDELAVLLAEQSTDGAEAMIQRVRAQVPGYRANLGLVTPWDVTIGTASFPEDGDTFEQLLAAADRRLYKQRGIDLAG